MSLPTKRLVAGVCGDGHIRTIEENAPELRKGCVAIDVQASLVSPGTELGGWRNLAGKRAKSDANTKPRPFGYSNAGIVAAVGEGVTRFKKGDRVACIGGGYALHTNYAIVPHNLTVALPDNVTFADGSYAMLAATALHAMRRGEPEFGEYAAIVGLGIVGLMAGQLYHLAGNYVIGWDTIPYRLDVAGKVGIDATVQIGKADEVAATKAFTRNCGLDAAMIAFGGDGTKAMQSLEKCMKLSPDTHLMGRIVVVGAPVFQYNPGTTNLDIRRAARTGPGYHDDPWEVGPDYPPVFMRWTTRTNLELCMRLISEGRLKVKDITTHTVALNQADEGTSAILDDPDRIIGLVFDCTKA
ncbi:MAG: hypothetical protein A3K19_05755 [Lentisphaerae bacterium RIFOXYB12_FULL_65_16]|nr:MAG: hypothetical protein A3K18_15370 [Lentisphaerae bacterium RIFOXYA12_64_32]OGV95077.1 MAG: hypothetical protein A3K19_05755 [Lentisphaerae bacterium RIFOXYB12_FULL_65_16]